ncbi:MAG: ankyrin repeat domain-containing protein, partial [Polyangiaceae bacterium]|nr:ankyrin repeat domain-containing protein [Polyangiaceae bacterium]
PESHPDHALEAHQVAHCSANSTVAKEPLPTEIVKMLLAKGVAVDPRTRSNGSTPLMAAATRGDAETVSLLIEHGAAPNAGRTDDGAQSLMMAARHRDPETTKRLLDARADPNARTTDRGTTALMVAAKHGNSDVAGLLLDKGADPDAKTTDHGATALMAAARGGHLETAEILLDMGAQPDARTTDRGTTALMLAAKHGQAEIASLLLFRDAQPNAKTTDTHTTALMNAVESGSVEVVQLLLERGAQWSAAAPGGGAAALLAAAESGHADIARLLLVSGAMPNAETTKAALKTAAKHQHHDVVKVLLAQRGGVMVRIPGGPLCMGSSTDLWRFRSAPVRVRVKPFTIDVTEVTVARYAACVDAGRCCAPKQDEAECNWGRVGREDHPVNCVSWDDATAYCSWAGKRLPTEAEWEFAARGPDGRQYPWGSRTSPGLCGNNEGTCEVASFPESDSQFGVKDMTGNVEEWTASPYSKTYVEDAVCRSEKRCVTRGGSFTDDRPAPATSRQWNYSTRRGSTIGFRCAR